jgi:hypothetical protein
MSTSLLRRRRLAVGCAALVLAVPTPCAAAPAPASASAEASRTVPAEPRNTEEQEATSTRVIGVLVGLAVVAIVGATLLVGLRKSG